MRCLIVEDDERIAADLADALTRAGFSVQHVTDGEEAWFIGGTEAFDLVILDLGLPSLDGLTLLKRWRSEGRNMPVLILTARGSWNERVEGIDAGADDYLPKPFHMGGSRRAGAIPDAAGFGPDEPGATDRAAFDRHTNRQTASIDERMLNISQLEFRLLSYLVHAVDRVVPPTELLEHMYGDSDLRDVNAIEAVIARLRRKTGAGVIGTRRGFGYYLEQEE